MRVGDFVLSIPTLLVAILVSAMFRELLPVDLRDAFAPVILVVSIADHVWVQYARIVRASDHGRGAQGICAGRQDHRGAARAAIMTGISCPT